MRVVKPPFRQHPTLNFFLQRKKLLWLVVLVPVVVKARINIGSTYQQYPCRTTFASYGNQVVDYWDGFPIQLKFVNGDPYLCRKSNTTTLADQQPLSKNHDTMVPSFSPISRSPSQAPSFYYLGESTYNEYLEWTRPKLSIWAWEGGPCNIQDKIAVAEASGASALIIASRSYFFTSDLDLPKEQQDYTTNLTVLSITKLCAMQFQKYINETESIGITCDKPDLQEKLLVPVAVAMILAFLYCLIVNPLCRVFCPDWYNRTIRPNTATSTSTASRRLLTDDFVDGLASRNVARELLQNGRDDSYGDDNCYEPPSCPVCLDALALNSQVTILPCGHYFHHTCIRPWLTQRQSNCPLCKFDLLPPEDDDENKRASATERHGAIRAAIGNLLVEVRLRVRRSWSTHSMPLGSSSPTDAQLQLPSLSSLPWHPSDEEVIRELELAESASSGDSIYAEDFQG